MKISNDKKKFRINLRYKIIPIYNRNNVIIGFVWIMHNDSRYYSKGFTQSYLGSNIQSEHIKYYVTKYQFYQQLPQQYATGKNRSTNTKWITVVEHRTSIVHKSQNPNHHPSPPPPPTLNERVINIIW